MARTSPITTSILIDDVPGCGIRGAPARISVDPTAGLKVAYQRADGSEGRLSLSMDALTQALDIAGVTAGPRRAQCFITSEAETNRTYGPYTNEKTAQAVALGKGSAWGGNGSVSAVMFVLWRDVDGKLLGLRVLDNKPVLVSEAAPDVAALEAALSKLDPAERAVVEAALGSRR